MKYLIIILVVLTGSIHSQDIGKAQPLDTKWEKYNRILNEKRYEPEIIFKDNHELASIPVIESLLDILRKEEDVKIKLTIVTTENVDMKEGVLVTAKTLSNCKSMRDVLESIVARNHWTFRMKDGDLVVYQYRHQ